MHRELPIPPAVLRSSPSQEMIRIWLAADQVHCVLNIGFWEGRGFDERECWGILLADLMHHIANAHEEQYGRDPSETISRMRDMFEREMSKPSSNRLGEFVAQRDADTSSNSG